MIGSYLSSFGVYHQVPQFNKTTRQGFHERKQNFFISTNSHVLKFHLLNSLVSALSSNQISPHHQYQENTSPYNLSHPSTL